MRLPIALMAALAGLGGGGVQAASVEVKDAVARVTVIPENRSDIRVEWVSRNPRLPLRVRTQGERTIVDGGLGRRIRACHGRGEAASVRVAGIGEVAYRDLPQVVIRTPRDVKLGAGGAVYGAVGRSASLDLANAGCGEWTLANVEGKLRISQAGSGDSHAGSAGEATIRVAGEGDVTAAEIRRGLRVDIAGSGDVAVVSASGPLDVRIAGSGDVKVAGGRVTAMTVSVAGSGDVNFGGAADSLRARIAGSGDVRARQVKGAVSKAVMGSGGVIIG